MKLSKNMNLSDRLIRLVIALLLLVIAYWRASWIIFAAALFVLFESVVGWCALYQILRKNSCSIKDRER
jgi:hypothetical protein